MTKTRINLGAGNRILNPEIYVNHDITYHRKEIGVQVTGLFIKNSDNLQYSFILITIIIIHAKLQRIAEPAAQPDRNYLGR